MKFGCEIISCIKTAISTFIIVIVDLNDGRNDSTSLLNGSSYLTVCLMKFGCEIMSCIKMAISTFIIVIVDLNSGHNDFTSLLNGSSYLTVCLLSSANSSASAFLRQA